MSTTPTYVVLTRQRKGANLESRQRCCCMHRDWPESMLQPLEGSGVGGQVENLEQNLANGGRGPVIRFRVVTAALMHDRYGANTQRERRRRPGRTIDQFCTTRKMLMV